MLHTKLPKVSGHLHISPIWFQNYWNYFHVVTVFNRLGRLTTREHYLRCPLDATVLHYGWATALSCLHCIFNVEWNISNIGWYWVVLLIFYCFIEYWIHRCSLLVIYLITHTLWLYITNFMTYLQHSIWSLSWIVCISWWKTITFPLLLHRLQKRRDRKNKED